MKIESCSAIPLNKVGVLLNLSSFRRKINGPTLGGDGDRTTVDFVGFEKDE